MLPPLNEPTAAERLSSAVKHGLDLETYAGGASPEQMSRRPALAKAIHQVIINLIIGFIISVIRISPPQSNTVLI